MSDEAALDAAGLLRSVGLLADGPGAWGRPIRAPGAGVFVVELPSPPATAPLDINRIGKWLERLPGLLLDGSRPTSKEIAARLAAFWIPSAAVLYIGTSEQSVAARVGAMERTILGDRRPYPGGGWLKTLAGLERARIWWAATTATEEYEDALISAFAASVPEAERARLPDPTVVLPLANLRSVGGEKKAHGLSGYLVPDDRPAPVPIGSIVDIADGDADGASGLPTRAAGGTVRRGPAPGRSGSAAAARAKSARPTPRPRVAASPRARNTAPPGPPRGEPGFLSPEGMARLREEHAELTGHKRPEVIA